jgi:hypothetical protein
LVACLDHCEPGLLVTDAVDIEPARLLEARDGIDRGRAKEARLGAYRGVPGGTEAAR